MSCHVRVAGSIALCAAALTACAAPGGSREAQRGATMRMHDEALERARAKWPELDGVIDRADGYAVVNSGVIKGFFLGLSSGYGVIVDQRSQTNTMIDTFSIGLGPAIELSNTNAIVVFHSGELLDAALSGDQGWLFGGTVGLGLEFGGFLGDLSAATIGGATTTYRDMRYGISFQAQVFGLDADVDVELQ